MLEKKYANNHYTFTCGFKEYSDEYTSPATTIIHIVV